jgi:signal transduction histidine kinase
MLFRDSVIPLSSTMRRLVIGTVAACALLEIAVVALEAAMPGPLSRQVQLLAVAALVLVWSGCVGEPSIRLWLAARGRAAVQRARLRAMSLGYLAIVTLLVVVVFSASLARLPVFQIGVALAGLAIVPLLYAGFSPPSWLRRTWRRGEEARSREATHDLVVFSADQATLGGRALEWAVRLTGAEGGFFVSAEDEIVAAKGMTADQAQEVRRRLAGTGEGQVVSLPGSPPRSASVIPIPGGEARIVLVSGPFTPIFGSDELVWLQQYAALVGAGLDRVRLSEALERMNVELEHRVGEVTERTHELEAANRELEAFSYSISHDLRAPLRAVNGFASILLEEHSESLAPEARGYLTRIRDNGEMMGRLVDDLLAFSRLGRQTVRKQRVRTRSVVERALAQLQPAIEGRRLQLVIEDLPDCDADPALLEQVFVNLLSNALKYSRKREEAHIEVGTVEAGTGAQPTFFVRDNGAGFDMAYADKLFGVFQRLHRSQDYEGTGVGLAIVQRIVDRHGGRVWAEAKLDQGATFYFSLKGDRTWQQATAA